MRYNRLKLGVLLFFNAKFSKYFGTEWVKGRRSFKIFGEISRCTLYISIARLLRLSWCIETDLSLSKRFSKNDFLSLYVKQKHLSCVLFIFFIFCAVMTHPNQRTIIELKHEEHIH